MTESTAPKIRKPFRGRRPRRPENPDSPATATENLAPPAEGGSPSPPVAAEAAPPAADAGGGVPRPPRHPRPQRPHKPGRGNSQGGQPGGRAGRPPRPPGAAGPEAGEGELPPSAEGRRPRPNDGAWNRSGKSRPAGPRGGGQPPWSGKAKAAAYSGADAGPGPERGNEIRRPRGIGPQFAEPVKLSRLLCDRGLCTPRDADAYIQRGWVIVNGERATTPAMRVHPAAEIRLAPEARGEQSRGVTVLFNQPVSLDAATGDAAAAVLAMIGPDTLDLRYDGPSFHSSHLLGLAPVGHLDIDATGLVVLTQDDGVARQLVGEEGELDEEYLVDVEGTPSDEDLDRLAAADGEAPAPLEVNRQDGDRMRIVVAAGRAAQIRQRCERAGLKLVEMRRVRIGDVRLGDLRQGQWRYLRDDESF